MSKSEKDIYINGPMHTIRLEGNIGKIKKVLYIFGDYHINCDKQTSCNNDDAYDIDKYLSNEFKELTNEVDFFLEIPVSYVPNYKTSHIRDKYIHNVRNFFSRNFNIEANKLVKRSEKYPLVRFHHLDIRQDNPLLYEYLFNQLFVMSDFLHGIGTVAELMNDFQTMNFIANKLDKMYNVFNNFINFSLQLEKEFKNIYYIKKIREKTKNKEVSNILNKYLDKFYTNIKNTQKIFMKYRKHIEELYYKLNNIEKIDINIINKNVIIPFSKIILEIRRYLDYQIDIPMDCYLLRRFLDKEYITNGILYCGMAHTADVVNILVNDFNFKITHHSGMIKPDELNKKIKEGSYNEQEVHNLLIKQKEYIYQCSNVKGFPKKFE
jgi:hypothetical protein